MRIETIEVGPAAGISLTEEQLSFRETAQRFATDMLAPCSKDFASQGGISLEIRRRMGDLGLIAMELPERFGGLGVSHVTSGVVTEAVAEGDLSVSYIQLLASLSSIFSAEEYLPILVITGDDSPEVRQRALAAGAMGFLTKPFDPDVVEALKVIYDRGGPDQILGLADPIDPMRDINSLWSHFRLRAPGRFCSWGSLYPSRRAWATRQAPATSSTAPSLLLSTSIFELPRSLRMSERSQMKRVPRCCLVTEPAKPTFSASPSTTGGTSPSCVRSGTRLSSC